MLLLGGGVGITPLRPLFETLPGEVDPDLLRARRAEDLALRDELEAIAPPAARRCTTRSAKPGRELPAADRGRIVRPVPDLAPHDVYLCGPPGMTEAAKSALRGAGVPRRRIHHESFAF